MVWNIQLPKSSLFTHKNTFHLLSPLFGSILHPSLFRTWVIIRYIIIIIRRWNEHKNTKHPFVMIIWRNVPLFKLAHDYFGFFRVTSEIQTIQTLQIHLILIQTSTEKHSLNTKHPNNRPFSLMKIWKLCLKIGCNTFEWHVIICNVYVLILLCP